MLQQKSPEDYVIATGQQHSVRDFVTLSGRLLGLELEWRGSGVDEHAVDRGSGKTVVRVDPRYFRPTEVDALLGDASKARRQLGWQPEIGFEALVREMIETDRELAKRDALVAREGFSVYSPRE
jgi:GDPmannose 4,6-dehydratase